MIIQAELKRKQSEYEGEACVVDCMPDKAPRPLSHAHPNNTGAP